MLCSPAKLRVLIQRRRVHGPWGSWAIGVEPLPETRIEPSVSVVVTTVRFDRVPDRVLDNLQHLEEVHVRGGSNYAVETTVVGLRMRGSLSLRVEWKGSLRSSVWQTHLEHPQELVQKE